jgi:uncharacterized membrane protein YuzA (DUF378 family)
MNDTHSVWLRIALLLSIVGAVNWGLVGAFDLNLVKELFGGTPMIERLIYIIVGLSGFASLMLFKSNEVAK